MGQDSSRFTRIFPWHDLLKSEKGPLKNDPVLKQHWMDLYHSTPQNLKNAIADTGQEEDRFLEFNVKQGPKRHNIAILEALPMDLKSSPTRIY